MTSHRIEPISRAGDPGEALAAVVADPLWMLARQRAYGELDGEDAGTPIRVDFRLASHPIDGWSAGEQMLPYDPGSQVLEALVAGESAGPSHSLRDRIDAGRYVAASVTEAAAERLRAKFPLDTTDTDDVLFRAAGERYCDGFALAAALAEAPTAAKLGISAAQWDAAKPALERFVTWCTTTFGMGPSTWRPERLERRFDLFSGGARVLAAGAHTREEVDVADLDLTTEGAALATTEEGAPTVRRIPSPIRFPGMPNDRYWAFEDAQLALARIDATTHDLARLALVEFSTVYGNDWFIFPVPISPGSIASVDDLVCTDSFGVKQLVRPADLTAWSMFAPSGPGTTAARLVVPAAAAGLLSGPVVEEVAFVRDENANLVWGLERVVTDAAGLTHDLAAEFAAYADRASALPAGAELVYRIMTDVPPHWVPFLPVQLADHRSVVLVEAVLPRVGDGGESEVVLPRSSVLSELQGVPLQEEEVPSAGVVIRRRWLLARSPDGGRHVWAARSVQTGRGEGASGLMFDIALEGGG